MLIIDKKKRKINLDGGLKRQSPAVLPERLDGSGHQRASDSDGDVTGGWHK